MSVESLDWGLLAQQVGLGALLGLAVGYTAKKALKVVLLVGGVLLLALLIMQNYDFININWHVVEEVYTQTFQHPGGILGSLADWASHLDSLLPVAGSFVVGFLVGLRLG